MKKIVFTALVMALSLTMSAKKPSILYKGNTEAQQMWVDSVYNSMSPRERAAQLFIPMVDPCGGASSKATISKWVETHKMGGLLFSKGSISEYVTMTNYAQSIADVPVLMTFDGEWGFPMRVKNTPRFPYNMGLGAIDDEQLLYEYGKEMARECRLMGIHVNFAPVLDVNSNPSNPVIGYRSFGEDPARVSRLGVAYSRGLEDGNVLSVSKHFPGHGDTSVDSHKALPTVDHDRTTLNTIDLLPFQQYIDAGLSSVMVGHLSVPALDKSGTPASMSKKITTDLLRGEMGFEGLIFTDALAMKGAKASENNCVAALMAGADMLLGSASPAKDLDAVMAAIKAGKITDKMIEERCKKVLSYKYALGLLSEKPAVLNGIEAKLNSSSADAINRKLAAASMTILRNETNLLPVRGLAERKVAVVNIGASSDNEFTRCCRKYAKVDVYSSTGAFSSSTLAAIKQHDVVIVGIYNDKSAQKQAFAQLKSIPNLVPVFFVNPYEMADFGASVKEQKTLVIAYDDTKYTREYAAQAIFGGIDVTGRMPVNLKGLAKMGDGVNLKKSRLGYTTPEAIGVDPKLEANVDKLVQKGLDTRAFPGCQVLVAKDGYVILDKGYGYLDFSKKDKVTSETIYDLASVSKATGTLPGVMKAYDQELFQLDAKVSEYIEPLQETNKENITVRQLLYHESGMPAAVNMFNMMMDNESYSGSLIAGTESSTYSKKIENGAYGHKDAQLRSDITSSTPTEDMKIEAAEGIYVGQATMDTIRERIHNIKLGAKKYNYSCLNFCLLMEMEECVTGRPHNEWVDETIFGPLGSYHTCYRPLERWDKNDIAPTEKDNFLRGQTLQGYVHDETANFSGGVQGNAGLFSNANDLAKLCQMWLNGGEYGGEQILSEETVEVFTKSKSSISRRGLGFDKPDKRNERSSPTCREASAATYGHLGFTGTCFWVDPDTNLIYIFLSNRVNPSRNNPAFSKLNIRPKIFSEVYKAITPKG